MARKKKLEVAPADPPIRQAKRRPTTFQVRDDLVDQVRDAVVFLAGDPEYLNMAEFVENAITRELERLKRKHRNGEPFPSRSKSKRRLKGGRPIKRD